MPSCCLLPRRNNRLCPFGFVFRLYFVCLLSGTPALCYNVFFLCSLPFVCFIFFRRKKKTPAPVPGDPRLYRAENLGRSALPRAYRGSRHVLPRADIASLGGGSAEPPQFERLRPAGALGPELLWRQQQQQQQQQRQRQRQPLRAAGLIVCSILTLHAARSVSFCQCSTGEDRGHRPS